MTAPYLNIQILNIQILNIQILSSTNHHRYYLHTTNSTSDIHTHARLNSANSLVQGDNRVPYLNIQIPSPAYYQRYYLHNHKLSHHHNTTNSITSTSRILHSEHHKRYYLHNHKLHHLNITNFIMSKSRIL